MFENKKVVVLAGIAIAVAGMSRVAFGHDAPWVAGVGILVGAALIVQAVLKGRAPRA